MKDRVTKYLQAFLKSYVFVELKEDFLKKAGDIGFMKGISIPVEQKNVARLAENAQLTFEMISENMIHVLGADPEFPYKNEYIRYMENYSPQIFEYIIGKGLYLAEQKRLKESAVFLRAALTFNEDSGDARYNYARVCRDIYLEAEEEDEVGCFKAEAFDGFEWVVEHYPDFAPGYYFLGYAYVNLGLYLKAQLIWKRYMEISREEDVKEEIGQRLEQLKEPVAIEKGYTEVMAGRYASGIELLEPFLKTDYRDWWPLSYYLGISYGKIVGKAPVALECFKRVLTLYPSHIESMLELATLYAAAGDPINAEKYRRKADLIKKQEE